MRIVKYPEISEIHCDVCNSVVKISPTDFRKGVIYQGQNNSLNYKCPICKHVTDLGMKSVAEEIQEDVANIFKAKAEEVNSLPPTETRKEIAKHLNVLYDTLEDYFQAKIEEDKPVK